MAKPHNVGLGFICRWSGGPDASAPNIGGLVVAFTAAAALKVGDAVYLSAANTVNKSATTATVQAAFIGFVVTGQALGFEYPESGTIIGVDAAAANQVVYVLVSGIAPAICTANVSAGAKVTPGATAGRVVTDAVATNGTTIGIAVTANTDGAGGTCLVKIGQF